MYESAKAIDRRLHDSRFLSQFFVGHGIDIGSAEGEMGQYMELFPKFKSLRGWDLEDGDGQYMEGVKDNTFDFVHSSHCLEHLRNPFIALDNWTRILKPGGHLIVTIPEANMYEQGVWPSDKNWDHKWVFTMNRKVDWADTQVSMIELCDHLRQMELVKLELLNHKHLSKVSGDQTLNPITESAIEVIWKKPI
jgi:SAM-dependent methyltransferase